MRRFIAAIALMTAPGSAIAGHLVPLDVALGDVSLQKVPFLMAADAGLYEKNGLKVHHFITPEAARAARENGVVVPPENVGAKGQKAPVMVGGGAALVGAVSSEKASISEKVIVATNENIVRDHVISSGDIKTEAELKGKRLGSSLHNVTGYDGIVYLERAGLAKDVTIVAPTSLSALKDGRADAVMANLFQSARAPELGYYDVVDVGTYHIPEAGSGVLVNRAWLKANADTMQRFLRTMVEGIRLMKSDKPLFAKTLKRWFNVTDEKMVDRLFQMAQGFPERAYPSAEGVAKAMQVFPGKGLDGLTPQSFYDDAPMRMLEKAGGLNRR